MRCMRCGTSDLKPLHTYRGIPCVTLTDVARNDWAVVNVAVIDYRRLSAASNGVGVVAHTSNLPVSNKRNTSVINHTSQVLHEYVSDCW